MVVKRFDVFLVNLDPTVGTEIQKTRPCIVISPDEMNNYIQTVIIAPMTTKARTYPTRVDCRFEDKDAQIVLDQIRTVDKRRLIKPLCRIDSRAQRHVLDVLAELFAE
ncbi:MAG TPA: type II toxin-antitoxin system PemK/MazF family toxin [Roseiflexaceae bacterium]|jgi:mRNA interferase MazF|nr:type II toxin-antitoxin system PemK/MazF family toxin [Roseiflexaceae bacterium]